jgi:hypothetical protein
MTLLNCSRQTSFRCAIAGFLLTGALAHPVSAQTPQINSVQFSGAAGNYALTLKGSGFGSPAVSPLPFTGDAPNFRIGNSTTFLESGYTGDALALTYRYWSNNEVVVSGVNAQPGNAITIAIWNQASQHAGTWGGTVPTSASTPQITSAELSGTGANLQIQINGSGFGSAPSTMPAPGSAGVLNYFRFTDFRAHCGSSSTLFEAGFQNWGSSPDSVTLYYQSWSDDQIVVSGFGGTYGQGCAAYQAGDPVAITVYNSADASSSGSQTAWGGPTLAHIAITVQDSTTGQPISSGSTITAGDEFQVTVTGTPEFNCAGQFIVTALGAPGNPPSVLVQSVPFIIGPASGNSAVGGTLSSNGTPGDENDWKISASCNGATQNSFASGTFEFLSAVP